VSADTDGGLDPDSPLGRFANPTCASPSPCARDVDAPGDVCLPCELAGHGRAGTDDGATLGLGEAREQGYGVGPGGIE
jgi:hypothetical protein